MADLLIKFILTLILGGIGGVLMAGIVIATGFRRQIDPLLAGGLFFLYAIFQFMFG